MIRRIEILGQTLAVRSILIFWHFLVLICGLSNLSHNNFVFPATRFYEAQVWIWDLGYNILLYYPLYFPVLIWFYRHELKSLSISKTNAIIFILLSMICNVPASYILLDGSFHFLDFIKIWLIYGISIPFSLFFLVIGLAFRKHEYPFEFGWAMSVGVVVFILVLRLIFNGSALPRLEDEIAYYIQSLIFKSSQFKINIAVLDLPEIAGIQQLYNLPYIFFKNGSYFSVHMHAWSAILALAGSQGHWMNYIFFVLMIPVFIFANRLTKLFPTRWEPLVIILFIFAPVLFFQSNSYMSHLSAAFVYLLVFVFWASIKTQKSVWSNVGAASLLYICVITLILIRPQAAAPLVLGIMTADLVSMLVQKKINTIYLLKFIAFVLAIGNAIFLMKIYANLYDSKSIFLTAEYFSSVFGSDCQSLGFGNGHGCFPTLGTAGYSFRKVVIRFFEILSMANQELNFLAIPIIPFLIYAIWKYRAQIVKTNNIVLALVLAIAFQMGVFLLYFHNGGESYRGRYLTETIAMLYLLLFYFLKMELKDPATLTSKIVGLMQRINPVLIWSILVLTLLSLQFMRTRANYFHPSIPAYRHVPKYQAKVVSNSWIIADEILPFTANRTGSGSWSFHSEFGDEQKEYDKDQIQSAFNTGLGTLMALARRIDQNGFVRDEHENILTGSLSLADRKILQKKFGVKEVYVLTFTRMETIKMYGKLRKIILPKAVLVPAHEFFGSKKND